MDKIIGNKQLHQSVLEWIQTAVTHSNKGETKSKETIKEIKKTCFLHGSFGIGKTLLINTICELLQLSSCSVDVLDESLCLSYFTLSSLTQLKMGKIVIVENVDTLSKSVLVQLVKQINDATNEMQSVPIVCIGNTHYIPEFVSIRSKITYFQMNPPSINEIVLFVTPLINRRKLPIPKTQLIELIHDCHLDIRFLCNTLEIMGTNKNNQNNQNKNNIKDCTFMNTFEVCKNLFCLNNDLDTKYDSFFLESSLMPSFVQENYVYNVFNSKNQMSYLDNSAYMLSTADIIGQQMMVFNDWTLQPHVAIHVLSATDNCNTQQIQYPKNTFKQFTPNKNAMNTFDCLMTKEKGKEKEKEKVEKKGKEKGKEKIVKEKIVKEKIVKEKEEFHCECGATVKQSSKSSHLKSKKHCSYIIKPV